MCIRDRGKNDSLLLDLIIHRQLLLAVLRQLPRKIYCAHRFQLFHMPTGNAQKNPLIHPIPLAYRTAFWAAAKQTPGTDKHSGRHTAKLCTVSQPSRQTIVASYRHLRRCEHIQAVVSCYQVCQHDTGFMLFCQGQYLL